MTASDIRLLFAYDRWATRRLLNAARDVDPAAWSRPNVIGERGMGGALVHALGAHMRWRNAWQGSGETPRPELEPLLPPSVLLARWEAEWVALHGYLDGLTDGTLNAVWDGLPLWQTMAHLVNHGTQHRSEAAAVLTEAGHSPGDLDLLDFLEDQSNSA